MRKHQRTFRLSAVALAAALLAASACGGPQAADSDPRRALYRRHCAACHGPDGQGGLAGAVRVPSLKEGPALSYNDLQLAEQIANGKGVMPPFKLTLTDTQIATLARFVREEIQGRK